jgi:methionyl-tRNA synthetase
MAERPRYFITTAIDYPNSRPHIGTAFEKLGADVQARYRRMEGFDVHFLMGNDENTIKVAKRAAELGVEPKPYCDDMARQFKEVWQALEISYDDFIQTSEPRHHVGCQKFIQNVFDAGCIRKGSYEGWYCEGCESFKTEKELVAGKCPLHPGLAAIRRTEPCLFFELSKFQQRLLDYYDAHPDFIQPESRRNEVLALVREGLQDINITRTGQTWGIPVPFAPEFTIYVWFDALLNYITAIGYGSDEEKFRKWWPADTHFIGKDITRFHCALWPAMLMAAGVEPPRMVFGHGFVYKKDESTGERVRESKSLGNVTEPMDLITQFNAEAFRYYFLRECPYPGDGEYSIGRFADLYNADLANNLGNLYSRVIRLVAVNYDARLNDTAGKAPKPIESGSEPDAVVGQIRAHVEACQYNQALQKIWQEVLDPSNQYADKTEPWKLVKTDKDAARQVLFDLVEPLRRASILLKPFLPKTAESIYTSFNFAKPWDEVRYADAARPQSLGNDLRILAQLDDNKVKPLFPRIA